MDISCQTTALRAGVPGRRLVPVNLGFTRQPRGAALSVRGRSKCAPPPAASSAAGRSDDSVDVVLEKIARARSLNECLLDDTLSETDWDRLARATARRAAACSSQEERDALRARLVEVRALLPAVAAAAASDPRVSAHERAHAFADRLAWLGDTRVIENVANLRKAMPKVDVYDFLIRRPDYLFVPLELDDEYSSSIDEGDDGSTPKQPKAEPVATVTTPDMTFTLPRRTPLKPPWEHVAGTESKVLASRWKSLEDYVAWNLVAIGADSGPVSDLMTQLAILMPRLADTFLDNQGVLVHVLQKIIQTGRTNVTIQVVALRQIFGHRVEMILLQRPHFLYECPEEVAKDMKDLKATLPGVDVVELMQSVPDLLHQRHIWPALAGAMDDPMMKHNVSQLNLLQGSWQQSLSEEKVITLSDNELI